MNNQATKELPVIVCAAVIISADKILITLRPEGSRLAGFWEFPGGKLDPGESPQQALIREIREELDITIRVGAIFETVYHRYDWGTALILAYLCDWTSGEIQHLEVADHRWVTAEEMASFRMLPADEPILRKLEKTIPNR